MTANQEVGATKACPCCGSTEFHDLLTFEEVPHSGVFRERTSDPIQTTDLTFQLCTVCALVRQKAFALAPDYSRVDRPTASQMPAYLGELLRDFQGYGIRRDDLIVEIGANDGSFLHALLDAGYHNVVGVEPSLRLAELARGKGLRIESAYLDQEFARILIARYSAARAVVCRHTLEHVAEPASFMGAVHRCLNPSGGVLLLEVPDGSAIPALLNIYELWDEHLYYFSQENARLLLERSRFGIEQRRSYPHLDTRNLVFWCSVQSDDAASSFSKVSSAEVDAWLQCPRTWAACKAAVLSAIHAAPRPIYCMGASHSQSNFINYAGFGEYVDFLIDDDPAKAGKLAPLARGHGRIVPSDTFIRSANAGTLVRTAFGYPAWMERLCAHAAGNNMHIIDPRSFRLQHEPDKSCA